MTTSKLNYIVGYNKFDENSQSQSNSQDLDPIRTEDQRVQLISWTSLLLGYSVLPTISLFMFNINNFLFSINH